MAGTLKSRAAPRRNRGGGRSEVWLLGMAMWAIASSIANAHFQLLYTPQAALRESAAIPLALVFSHPFDNGFTMDMGRPEAFYVVSQRGDAEPKTTDLMQYLEPVQWSGVDSKAAAFIARPPRSV